MDLATLEALIAAELAARADQLGLSIASLRVEYVLNWGGFVNQSFRIDDGRRRLHLKLSDDPDAQAALAAWYRIHADLTTKYHAPPVLDWVTIRGSDNQGLLFPHLEGATPSRWSRELRQAVVAVAQALHIDRDLRERALPGQEPGSCEADYRGDFHRRFTEDLAYVSARRPAFVTESVTAWMEAEVERLASTVARSAAFAGPADALIHGDLWPNNVLVAPNGTWYFLDWDDLRLGDPILDLAKLLDPGTSDGEPPSADEVTALIGTDPDARERLAFYTRAILLDWIIDPLADYVAADQAPQYASRVRAQKRKEHVEALARYRDRYHCESARRIR